MSCFYPMQAIRTTILTKSGKNVIKFVKANFDKSIQSSPDFLSGLPCGQCTGCRLERSRQWAIRMMHEAQMHQDNCFITLTFDDDHLFDVKSRGVDNPMSLHKPEFQAFMKRLRTRISDPNDSLFIPEFSKELPLEERKVVRFYMCGEYGEKYKRPHYHAIIFGLDFSDKQLEKIDNGMRYYSSATLRELWPSGNNIITDVTFDSCAYVARYIMKKHLGKDAWMQYFDYIDENTGECVGHRVPEYTIMSRRSGIGKEWLDKYLEDIYPKDKVFMRGRGYSKPPKYYDSQYEIIDPEDLSRIKQARIEAAKLRSDDNTPGRLHAKQSVKDAQISVLKRNLE